MKDKQVRLSQIVTHRDIGIKNVGTMHTVSNSLKRNALQKTAHFGSVRPQDAYDSRLPLAQFSRRDLSLILRYIEAKKQSEAADRNFIRRVLLALFPEDLVIAGGREMATMLRVQEGRPTEQHCVQSKFCFLLRGAATVTRGSFSYPVQAGQAFGELQLMANEELFDEVIFHQKYLMLTLSRENFTTCLRPYFTAKFNRLEEEVWGISQLLQRAPLLNKFHFLSRLRHKVIHPGQIISKANDPIVELQFLPRVWHQKNGFTVSKCPGLYETLKDKAFFVESVFNGPQQHTVCVIKASIFRDLILRHLGQSINVSNLKDNQSSLTAFMPESVPRQPISSFMRHKKVKLTLPRNARIKTEGSANSVQTQFRFFKRDSTLLLQERYRSSRLSRSRQQAQNHSFLQYSMRKPWVGQPPSQQQE